MLKWSAAVLCLCFAISDQAAAHLSKETFASGGQKRSYSVHS